MLIELRIQGYAVIDDQSLRLGSGLNALTGETGAGKASGGGAISLLLGERASSEVIRTKPGLIIVKHRLGFVGANAGSDQSNIDHANGECALLLPEDIHFIIHTILVLNIGMYGEETLYSH